MKVKTKKKGQQTPLSRKQQRKQLRRDKKARRQEYYENRGKSKNLELNSSNEEKVAKSNEKAEKKVISVVSSDFAKNISKEKKQKVKLEKEMQKQRKKQLKIANEVEDRTIKQLEKQLKLNKKKSKAVPKSFQADGLDYLLEVCDSENIKEAVSAEQQLSAIDNEFDEDLKLMTESQSSQFESDLSSNECDSENESEADVISANKNINKKRKLENESEVKTKKVKIIEENDGFPSSEDEIDEMELNSEFSDNGSKSDENEATSGCDGSDSDEENSKKREDGTWEDIYGRLRSKDGSIIKSEDTEKYIPPAIRAKLANEDIKQKEKLERLRKQIKGLTNRLAESNMHSIAAQIERLYMSNSRHDMNDTLTSAVLGSATAAAALTPERLILEHAALVAILHANVGAEVGAHFLQTAVQKFDECYWSEGPIEDKTLDNLILILAQLNNFNLVDSHLIYDILNQLSERFTEKDVECILLVLKSIGFTLRKDNPLALKELIINLQKKAANIFDDEKRDNARVKFMLDILMAIKDNNVTKIPNYDTTYSEHLKKLLKGFIRKGNYVTQLNISLQDLLKADEKGKWWIVGSAWKGSEGEEKVKEVGKDLPKFSAKLLELAKKQRMNTDTRRDVFCIIMSAEDYLDAFEKLCRLGLKNQQEREIIFVILHCCLQEQKFNPFYALLVQKFCDSDRKFQMTVKCSIWDKLKALSDCSGAQISNLAKLLIHLFLEKSLPISTLKIVQFSELDKLTLRFMRQILLGILLHQDTEACLGVFEKVSIGEKLKLFRESLRLFIHHFLLRNLKEGSVPENQKKLLHERAELIEKLLSTKERKNLM